MQMRILVDEETATHLRHCCTVAGILTIHRNQCKNPSKPPYTYDVVRFQLIEQNHGRLGLTYIIVARARARARM